MNLSVLNDAEDVEWLKDTHLKGKSHPDFKSFILCGNEDCPDLLELYVGEDPLFGDSPVAVFVLNNENGELERKEN